MRANSIDRKSFISLGGAPGRSSAGSFPISLRASATAVVVTPRSSSAIAFGKSVVRVPVRSETTPIRSSSPKVPWAVGSGFRESAPSSATKRASRSG